MRDLPSYTALEPSSIIALVILAVGKGVDGKQCSGFTVQKQFLRRSPKNIGVNIHLHLPYDNSPGRKILQHLAMLLEPHIMGGTHVRAQFLPLRPLPSLEQRDDTLVFYRVTQGEFGAVNTPTIRHLKDKVVKRRHFVRVI